MKTKVMTIYVLLVVAVLVIFITPSVSPEAYNSRYETRVLKQINHARDNHGLPPVKAGYCIDQRAEHWAHHLKRTQTFYHQDLGIILKECGGIHTGEIMGKGDGPPRKFKRMWMHSPAHRHVILSDFDKVGVSAVHTTMGRVVVIDFIKY